MPAPAGPHCCTPSLFFRARLGLVDGVGLPQHVAGVGVERRDVAAEGAALVLGASALAFLVQTLHRHEHAAVVVGRRAGDRRGAVIVNLADPDLLAGVRVHRVGVGAGVAEEDRLTRAAGVLVRADRHRGAHAGLRLERPVGAAGLRIERVHLAVLAGDEQAAAGDRRLRARRRHGVIAERPLELQLRQIGGGQPAVLLISRVRDIAAPAVPLAARGGCAHRGCRRAFVHDDRRHDRTERLAGREHRDGALLSLGQADRLDLHAAERQRVEDPFGRHLPQDLRASEPSSDCQRGSSRTRA